MTLSTDRIELNGLKHTLQLDTASMRNASADLMTSFFTNLNKRARSSADLERLLSE